MCTSSKHYLLSKKIIFSSIQFCHFTLKYWKKTTILNLWYELTLLVYFMVLIFFMQPVKIKVYRSCRIYRLVAGVTVLNSTWWQQIIPHTPNHVICDIQLTFILSQSHNISYTANQFKLQTTTLYFSKCLWGTFSHRGGFGKCWKQHFLSIHYTSFYQYIIISFRLRYTVLRFQLISHEEREF